MTQKLECDRCKEWSRLCLSSTCPSCDMEKEMTPKEGFDEKAMDEARDNWRYPKTKEAFEAGARWQFEQSQARIKELERSLTHWLGVTQDKEIEISAHSGGLIEKDQEIARLKSSQTIFAAGLYWDKDKIEDLIKLNEKNLIEGSKARCEVKRFREALDSILAPFDCMNCEMSGAYERKICSEHIEDNQRVAEEALNFKPKTATSADLKPKTDIEGGG